MIDSIRSQNITGLICIDLWEDDPYNKHVIWKNEKYLDWSTHLVEALFEHEWHSIINACYGIEINYDDVSVFNTLLEYNWKHHDSQIMDEFIKNTHTLIPPKKLKELFRHVQLDRSFLLYTVESFLKHKAKFCPEVNNWLIVGAAWHLCVHYRDLGLINLNKIKNDFGLQIYGSPIGFFKTDSTATDDDFVRDHLSWKKVADELYIMI